MADAHAPPIPGTASESPSPPTPPPPPSADDPPPQRYYNLGSILSSAKDVKSSAQVTAAAEGVLGSACFRTAGLWAIAVSAAFGAHRFKQGGSPRRMLNDALLAGLLTFGTQWYICRNAEVDRRATFKAFYMRRPPDAAPRPAPGDDDGELADAVDRELARVTRYELPEVVVPVGLDGQPLVTGMVAHGSGDGAGEGVRGGGGASEVGRGGAEAAALQRAQEAAAQLVPQQMR